MAIHKEFSFHFLPYFLGLCDRGGFVERHLSLTFQIPVVSFFFFFSMDMDCAGDLDVITQKLVFHSRCVRMRGPSLYCFYPVLSPQLSEHCKGSKDDDMHPCFNA